MPIQAWILQVLIASPGDTAAYRDAIEDALHAWNSDRAGSTNVQLLPRRWETDAVPSLEGDAQSVINAQLVDEADIVFGVFHTRLGSVTPRAASGTAEELDRSRANGKKVHVYFSNAPIPRDHDKQQLAALDDFKETLTAGGLCGSFDSEEQLRNQVRTAVEHDVAALLQSVLDSTPGAESGPLAPRPSGGLFSSLVDATLVQDKRVARQEIKAAIAVPEPIPSRYHYTCDGCAEVWLHRSEAPSYTHQQNTMSFWSDEPGRLFARQVSENLGSAFDYVSLGPGDGKKDGELVATWLSAGVDLIYYPYDVSVQLAAAAVEAVRKRARSVKGDGKLTINAVLADFRDLERVKSVFGHRSAPNVVALFGTLGNLANEGTFLTDLNSIMGDDDLLMLEVRLASDADDINKMTPEDSRHHDFGPLDHYFGLKFRNNVVKARWRMDASAVPKTKTLETYYEGRVPGLAGIQTVSLQYIHLYDPASFLAAIKRAGFQVVGEPYEGEGFLECLLKRRD